MPVQFVAGVYVRYVQFDDGLLENFHRIGDCNRSERISRRVNDERVRALSTGLNEFDDCSLEIRLMERKLDAQMVCELPAFGLKHLERRVSVYVWLTYPQIVEIGSVYNHQSCRHTLSPSNLFRIVRDLAPRDVSRACGSRWWRAAASSLAPFPPATFSLAIRHWRPRYPVRRHHGHHDSRQTSWHRVRFRDTSCRVSRSVLRRRLCRWSCGQVISGGHPWSHNSWDHCSGQARPPAR